MFFLLFPELLDAVAPLFPPTASTFSSPSDLLMRSLSASSHGPSGRESDVDDDVGAGAESDDPWRRSTLLQGGAPCHCPPACARTTYGATLSGAGFPNGASRVLKDLGDVLGGGGGGGGNQEADVLNDSYVSIFLCHFLGRFS